MDPERVPEKRSWKRDPKDPGICRKGSPERVPGKGPRDSSLSFKKRGFPTESPEKNGKSAFFNFLELLGNVYSKYYKRLAKIRRTILLHFGLVTFRFADTRALKPIISMISGFSDVSLSPKTNYFYLWRPQDTSKKPRI